MRLHRWSGRVFADYRQFYLRDPATDPPAPTDYTDEDVRRRLKVAPELVVVQPARNTAAAGNFFSAPGPTRIDPTGRMPWLMSQMRPGGRRVGVELDVREWPGEA